MPQAQAESDFGGGFEEVDAGKYHFAILESQINPPKKSGGVFDGYHCVLQVRQGTRPDMIGRKLTARFAFTNPTQSEKGQRFLRQKIFNLLVAVGIAREEDRGSSKSFNYTVGGEDGERDDLKGKQIVAYVVTDPSKSTYTDDSGVEHEREYLNPDIDGVHIYHVHNPKVADVPKDVKAAKLIPIPAAYKQESQATPPAANGSTGANGNGSSSKSSSPASPEPATVAAGSSEPDLSDLLSDL